MVEQAPRGPAMAKRFRLRIWRVIPSFHSCRSKDDAAATAAATASPVFLPAVNPLTRRALPAEADPSAYLWREEAKWHVVARAEPSPRVKIDSGEPQRELFPPLQLQRRPRRAAKKKKKRKAGSKPPRAGRVSTSSADTHWFSTEEEEEEEDEEEEEYEEDYDYEETETLVSSSRSFSTGYSSSSSEFNPRLKPIRESPDHQRSPEAAEGRRSSSASSLLRRFLAGPPCVGGAAAGKVAESFAVVKRSEDPYRDFRRSMVEMVVEKGIYEEGELEKLLRCFLSLNSRFHHAAIVRAFSDVWAALFAPSSRSSCASAAVTPPPALTPRRSH